MTEAEVRRAIFRALASVAPEIEPDMIDPKANLRDEIDIDSMDFLNFVIALHGTLGVDIPEADYPQLASIDKGIAYLAAKLRM